MKVVILQRICPHYRKPVFAQLANKVNMVLFYGKGTKSGAHCSDIVFDEFPAKYLFSFHFEFYLKERNYFVSFFPFLLIELFKVSPDVILTEGSTNILNNIFVFIYCKISRGKYIWWDAGKDINSKSSFLRNIFEPLNIFLMRNASGFVGYSERARSYFQSVGIPDPQIYIAQNTVSLENENDTLEHAQSDLLKKQLNIGGKTIILFVGSLEPRKKINNLLMTYSKLRLEFDNLCLLIIGDGIERKGLEGNATYKNMDIFFLGRITNGLHRYFKISDFLVLPGWSTLAINQSMAYGIPVVSVSTGGPEYEIIENYVNGIVIAPDNLEDLENAVRFMIVNPKKRLEMGVCAKKTVSASAGISNMVNIIVNALTDAYAL